jgi:hypothetical protein
VNFGDFVGVVVGAPYDSDGDGKGHIKFQIMICRPFSWRFLNNISINDQITHDLVQQLRCNNLKEN